MNEKMAHSAYNLSRFKNWRQRKTRAWAVSLPDCAGLLVGWFDCTTMEFPDGATAIKLDSWLAPCQNFGPSYPLINN